MLIPHRWSRGSHDAHEGAPLSGREKMADAGVDTSAGRLLHAGVWRVGGGAGVTDVGGMDDEGS